MGYSARPLSIIGLSQMRPQHRLIELPKHADARGALVFGQEGNHVPFPIKRFFTVFDVASGATRADLTSLGFTTFYRVITSDVMPTGMLM